MSSFSDLRTLIGNSVADWRTLHLSDLQFWHRSEARLMLIGLISLLLVLVIARAGLSRRRPGRHQIVLPAIPKSGSVRAIASGVSRRHLPAGVLSSPGCSSSFWRSAIHTHRSSQRT